MANETNNRKAILDFAKVAEDLGVGAYQGAAAAIANKDYLAGAGSIVQVEARHAAIVNYNRHGLVPPGSTLLQQLSECRNSFDNFFVRLSGVVEAGVIVFLRVWKKA